MYSLTRWRTNKINKKSKYNHNDYKLVYQIIQIVEISIASTNYFKEKN